MTINFNQGLLAAWFDRRGEKMPEKFEVLATYNAEVARGLMHDPNWETKMAALQEEFDQRAGLDNPGRER